MKVDKKVQAQKEVNLASMPDIIFLLLFFFMVTTVIKKVTGIPVELPSANQIQKIESKRHLSYIFLNKEGRVSVDDMFVKIEDISDIMYDKVNEDPQLLVSLKFDKNLRMDKIYDVQNELRKGQCLRINYAANFKER